jgi:hypothetical protein
MRALSQGREHGAITGWQGRQFGRRRAAVCALPPRVHARSKADIGATILDEVIQNLPPPRFTAAERKFVATNDYAHVWHEAVGGMFARAYGMVTSHAILRS